MTDNPGWTPPVEPGPPAPPGQWGATPPQQPQWAPGAPGQWGAAPGQWSGQNSPWGAPPASKPGVIPLRPLGLGEILDGAFSVIREYPKVTLGLSAIVVAVAQVVSFGLQFEALRAGDYGSGFAGLRTGGASYGGLLGFAINAVAGVVLAGMLTAVMGDAVLGREATLADVWGRIRPRFWALLGAGFVAGVVPYLALAGFLIPGIFLWGAWALVTPALVLERIGVGAALRRSWRLATSDWWRVWGIRALATVIATVLAWIIVFPLAALAVGVAANSDNLGLLPITLLLLAQIVAGTITAPFTSGVLSLLYIDRRMRAEGLDVTLAQAAATQAAQA